MTDILASEPVAFSTTSIDVGGCEDLFDRIEGWTIPIEFEIVQRWDVGAGDTPSRQFDVRYRNSIDLPILRCSWFWNAGDIDLSVDGTDRSANSTGFDTLTSALVAADGLDFITRFRIEATSIMARTWFATDPDPGGWQVTASGGGFVLTDDIVFTLNRLEDLFNSQWPDPTTFWQDTLSILSGFGTVPVSDTFSVDVPSGGWGQSQLNGVAWEVEGSANAGVTGGEAFWTAANLETAVASQLIIPANGWGTGPCGRWTHPAEILELTTPLHGELAYVDGEYGVLQYTTTPADDPQQVLKFDAGTPLPIEIEVDFITLESDEITPRANGDLFFYWGPYHYQDVDSWITWGLREGPEEIAVEYTNNGGFDWPVDPGDPGTTWFSGVGTLVGAAKAKWLIDSTGQYGKVWLASDPEPDWQVSMLWTTPPPASMFRYFYIESIVFNSPLSSPQPFTKIDRVSIGGSGGAASYGSVSWPPG